MKKLLVLAAAIQMTALVAGEINIKGLDKIALVKALYSRASGGFQLNDESAESASRGYIDTINGRVMKIDVSGNRVDTWLYNQYYGRNEAELIIGIVRFRIDNNLSINN